MAVDAIERPQRTSLRGLVIGGLCSGGFSFVAGDVLVVGHTDGLRDGPRGDRVGLNRPGRDHS